MTYPGKDRYNITSNYLERYSSEKKMSDVYEMWHAKNQDVEAGGGSASNQNCSSHADRYVCMAWTASFILADFINR